jgi:hypothetical protein
MSMDCRKYSPTIFFLNINFSDPTASIIIHIVLFETNPYHEFGNNNLDKNLSKVL